MPKPRTTVPMHLATATQRAIDALGGPTPVARLMEEHTGLSFARQSIQEWYSNGHLPYVNCDLYITIIAGEITRKNGHVDPEQLLADIPVPGKMLRRLSS